jgi:predicted nucleic-acid-binding protein
MIAIDTNIVVRYLTGDHPEQSARARALVDAGPVFVPVTVLLEAEWVLRSAYRLPAPDIASALRAFGGLPTVSFDDALMVAEALDRAERGMDFADALHFGKANGCEGFATFDQKFIKAAQREGIEGVREP